MQSLILYLLPTGCGNNVSCKFFYCALFLHLCILLNVVWTDYFLTNLRLTIIFARLHLHILLCSATFCEYAWSGPTINKNTLFGSCSSAQTVVNVPWSIIPRSHFALNNIWAYIFMDNCQYTALVYYLRLLSVLEHCNSGYMMILHELKYYPLTGIYIAVYIRRLRLYAVHWCHTFETLLILKVRHDEFCRIYHVL